MTVLLTSIGVPRLRDDTVARPRLVRALGEGLSRKVILVTAEAGYGKTTLLSQFVHTLGWPVAWHTVTESGRDPATLLGSLIAALDAARPGTTFAASQVLTSLAETVDGWRTVADALINGLAQALPQDTLLVLDDVHLVADGPSAPIPGYLAANLPAHVRLVLAGRERFPAGEIVRLAGHGEVLELDRAALAFTPEEASVLLAEHGAPLLSPEDARLTRLHTEGWPLALQLLKHALRGGSRAIDTIRTFSLGRRDLYTYFGTQVLDRLTSENRLFLLRISILDEIEDEICGVIGRLPDARNVLRALEERGLFLTALDSQGRRYRLHPLFRDTLRLHLERNVGSEEVERLHAEAGGFLVKQGRAVEAIPYLLRGNDHQAIVGHLEAEGERWLQEGRGKAVAGWIEALPRETVEASAPVLMLRGWLASARGDWDGFLRDHSRAATLTVGDTGGVARYGQATALFYLHRFDEARRVCAEAIAIDGLSARTRGRLLRRIGACDVWAGSPEKAGALFQQAMTLFQEAGDLSYQVLTLRDMSFLHQQLQPEFDWPARLLTQAMDLYRRADHLAMRADVAQVIGELLHAKGDHVGALRYLEETRVGATLLDNVHRLSLCLFYRGAALHALGRFEEAREVFEQGMRLSEERHTERYVEDFRLGLALLAWTDGRHEEASSLLGEIIEVYRRRNTVIFIPPLQLRLALLAFEMGDVQEARAHLLEAKAWFLDWGARRRTVQCDLYLAAVQHRETSLSETNGERGNSAGLAQLLAAIRMERLDRLFREHPVLLKPLLVEAIIQGAELDYVTTLLAGLDDVALLSPAVNHPSAVIRVRALEVLERIDREESREVIASLLKDHDPSVRSHARQTLTTLSGRPTAPLYVRMLGGFDLRKGDEDVPPGRWRRRRDRLLFVYLLLERKAVARDALVEAFWPDVTPSAAATSLNVAWSGVKRALEPFLPERAPSAYLIIDGRRYGLQWSAITTDLQEFERQVALADRAGDLDRRMSHLEAAAGLYRGDLLPDEVNEPWTVIERERVRSAYLRVLERLGEGMGLQGRQEEAVEVLRTALRLEPWREETYGRLMRLLAGTGRRSEALHLYRQCEALLRRELGVAPSPETTVLFEAIAAGTHLRDPS